MEERLKVPFIRWNHWKAEFSSLELLITPLEFTNDNFQAEILVLSVANVHWGILRRVFYVAYSADRQSVISGIATDVLLLLVKRIFLKPSRSWAYHNSPTY